MLPPSIEVVHSDPVPGEDSAPSLRRRSHDTRRDLRVANEERCRVTGKLHERPFVSRRRGDEVDIERIEDAPLETGL